MRPGQSFESKEVAHYYQYRPDYSDALIDKLCSLSNRRAHALDLGCGPGKVAGKISKHFDSVTAVDPSRSMLDVAKRAHRTQDNINWVCSPAETANLESAPFDLVVAAASIHWMDHSLLFPKLLRHVADDHVFAVVNGDDAYLPPWQTEWDEFLKKWIQLLTGERYEPGQKDSAFSVKMERHKSWLDMMGSTHLEHTVSQPIEEFVLCQLSRDTFAPSRLKDKLAEFEEELTVLLRPHADEKGMLEYQVRANLEWGTIKSI